MNGSSAIAVRVNAAEPCFLRCNVGVKSISSALVGHGLHTVYHVKQHKSWVTAVGWQKLVKFFFFFFPQPVAPCFTFHPELTPSQSLAQNQQTHATMSLTHSTGG